MLYVFILAIGDIAQHARRRKIISKGVYNASNLEAFASASTVMELIDKEGLKVIVEAMDAHCEDRFIIATKLQKILGFYL
jgi:hypothetical protein